jgi:CBS domain-containing protein
MARYERDYGRDSGWWEPGADARFQGRGGGTGRRFGGGEGGFGEWFGGRSASSYDDAFQAGEWNGWGGGGQRNRYGSGRGGSDYGGEYRGGRGGGGREMGYGGRDTGYMDAWQEQGGARGQSGWREQSGGRERTRAAEIMTENPQAVTPDATISEVAQQMRDLDVGIIPVVESTESRRLRGVITDRDIAVRAVAEGRDGNSRVADCMTDRIRTVNKNDSVQDVMRLMRQEQVRRVPVTDREGRLVGIIAQADLAVDYAGNDRSRESEVGETIERISEPAQPQRGGARMAASGRAGSSESGPRGGSNPRQARSSAEE